MLSSKTFQTLEIALPKMLFRNPVIINDLKIMETPWLNLNCMEIKCE